MSERQDAEARRGAAHLGERLGRQVSPRRLAVDVGGQNLERLVLCGLGRLGEHPDDWVDARAQHRVARGRQAAVPALGPRSCTEAGPSEMHSPSDWPSIASCDCSRSRSSVVRPSLRAVFGFGCLGAVAESECAVSMRCEGVQAVGVVWTEQKSWACVGIVDSASGDRGAQA